MKKQYRIYLFSALILVLGILADQLSKQSAINRLMDKDSYIVIKDVLRFTYLENRGAAFGSLTDARWVFLVFSTVGILALCAYLLFVKHNGYLLPLSLAMIASGGVGNMIDRIRLGYVVDFIYVALIDFAVFNIADCFVCVGVGLLIYLTFLDVLRESRQKKKEAKGDE